MSEQTHSRARKATPCLTADGWATVDDAMRPANDEDVDFDWVQALEDEGFEEWARIGGQRSLAAAPLMLQVYRRAQQPRFLVEVTGNINMAAERAYAETLPDLMRLLREWIGVAQSAAIVQLLATLPTEPDGFDESAQPDLAALARLLRASHVDAKA